MIAQDVEKMSSRINIIRTVQTPLGFFSLAVLVVEVILGISANLTQGADRTFLIVGMLILIFSLVLIVAGFAFFRPEALSGIRPNPGLQKLGGSQLLSTVEIINKPTFLLASASHEYTRPYFQGDVKVTKELFAGRQIKVSEEIKLAQFKRLLTSDRYDVLHLTIPVDRASGSLKFDSDEEMSAEAFSELVKKCEAKLVVLAICDSLMLAARIAKTANMIAAIEEINNEDFLEWEEMFYKSLSQGDSLSSAYEFARKTTNAEMVLLLRNDFVISE